MSSVRNLDQEILAEMSMVDIVYTLLKEGDKQPRPFLELLEEVITLKRSPEEQRMDTMSRLYTEINIDGRFKALGDNVWGLRSWYPVEQAEEIVITDVKKKVKKKKAQDDDDFEDFDELDDLDDDALDPDDLDEDYDDLDGLDDDEDLEDDTDEDLDVLEEDIEELEDLEEDFEDEDLEEIEDEDELSEDEEL